jgi:D-alanine-D-alanine ligase
MLIEGLIDGQEITVSILGEVALPVIEIVPPANEEFDYENKYNGKTQELCPPQNVSEAIQKEAQNLAIKVQKILGVRHLSRVDMMLRGDQLYILEINTMPGLTDQSLFPKSARVAGLDMAQLSHKLLVLANTSVA